jgi:hypothetical protein
MTKFSKEFILVKASQGHIWVSNFLEKFKATSKSKSISYMGVRCGGNLEKLFDTDSLTDSMIIKESKFILLISLGKLDNNLQCNKRINKFKNKLLIGLICRDLITDKVRFNIIEVSTNPDLFYLWCILYNETEFTKTEFELYPPLINYVNLEKIPVSDNLFWILVKNCMVPQVYAQEYNCTSASVLDFLMSSINRKVHAILRGEIPAGFLRKFK